MELKKNNITMFMRNFIQKHIYIYLSQISYIKLKKIIIKVVKEHTNLVIK